MNFEGSAGSEKAANLGIVFKSSQVQFRTGNNHKPKDAQVWDSAIAEILNYNNNVYA